MNKEYNVHFDDETVIEKIKFEIEYFFDNLTSKFRNIKKGTGNLIKYFPLIWNDRWWDSMFLHDMLRFKLNDMQKEWKNAHYVGSEYEEKLLKELVEILDEIRELEDDLDIDAQGKISNLYQEFGIKLFSIQRVEKTNEEFKDGKHVSVTTNMERLWD